MKSKLTPLRLARLRKGLCQWEAAKQTGIFQSKISLFENDLVDPTEKEKEKLAKTLGVSVNEIWLNQGVDGVEKGQGGPEEESNGS